MENNREILLKSKEYWMAKVQSKLFSIVEDYLQEKGINKTKFAEELGVSKGYISQVLNGDYDHRISKFIDLSLAVGKVPFIEFMDIEKIIEIDNLSNNGVVFNNYSVIVNDYFYSINQQNELATSQSIFLQQLEKQKSIIEDNYFIDYELIELPAA